MILQYWLQAKWLFKCRIKANVGKSSHITFVLRGGNCSSVTLNNEIVVEKDSVKYLGVHLNRPLTWKEHIITKINELGIKFRNLYGLMGRASSLSLYKKTVLYKQNDT